MMRAKTLQKSLGVSDYVSKCHLHDEGFPLRFTLDGLDGHVVAFPLGFADDSKRSPSHHLKASSIWAF